MKPIEVPARFVIKNFLRSKGVTHWVNWDLADNEEIEEATAWFQKQLADFERFRRNAITFGYELSDGHPLYNERAMETARWRDQLPDPVLLELLQEEARIEREGWPAPTIEHHEVNLVQNNQVLFFGPEDDDLPGTRGTDLDFQRVIEEINDRRIRT